MLTRMEATMYRIHYETYNRWTCQWVGESYNIPAYLRFHYLRLAAAGRIRRLQIYSPVCHRYAVDTPT